MNRQRLDLASLQHSKEFQDLDQRLQTLTINLSQGPKGFEKLKELMQNENARTKEQVSNQSREHERRLAEEEHRTQLLKSLWFAEIFSREETIAEAHSETFQWIFDRSGQAVQSWDNFVAWLENGEGTYWISGKAGSGKSTLMNFLCQDERTIEALKIWARRKDILMPKFFFWKGGKTMQKSFEGLLRSLLWQVLHEFPETESISFDVGSRSVQNRSSREHGSIRAWTIRRLQRTLQEVIDKLQSSCHLCFFIDGLDEFDEDEDKLIAFIQDVVMNTGVKVCASSRPSKIFEDAFGPSAKLQLQDLTDKDIEQYVTDQFQRVPQLKSMISQNEFVMNNLKKQIVTRAQGVFLWVSLAIKDLIRGLRNEDSPEQLQKRLACLPSEVEGIYLGMLLQIDKIYRHEASQFLQMAVHVPGLPLLYHALATYKGLDNLILSADQVSDRKFVLLCQLTRKRVLATCAGLLEVNEHQFSNTKIGTASGRSSEKFDLYGDISQATDKFDGEKGIREASLWSNNDDPSVGSETRSADAKAFDLQLSSTVNFIHRTAVDFLRSPELGGKFLQANLPPEFDPQVLYVKSSIAKLRLMPLPYPQLHLDSIDWIREEVAIAEDRTGKAQPRLRELIDRTTYNSDRGRDRSADLNLGEQDSLNTKTSSRSSSRVLCSTMSKPATPGNWNSAQIGTPDLHAFAALHGLSHFHGSSHYVQQMLECREKSCGPGILDYILYCSIFFASYEMGEDCQFTRALRIVPELLRRGADPNADFLMRTIWREYLGRMLGHLAFMLNWRYNAKIHSNVTQRPYHVNWDAIVMPTIAFVEYGADVHKIWHFHFGHTIILSTNGIGPISEAGTIESACSFDIQLSALSALNLCLRDKPEYPLIREMCIARGAFSYAKCTVLEVISKQEQARYKKKYELSEQESRDFLALFEQYVALRGIEVPLVAADLSRQILEFYDRLDEVRPDSSTSRVMDCSWLPGEREFEWSMYTSRFESGTMGLRIPKAENRQKWLQAHSS